MRGDCRDDSHRTLSEFELPLVQEYASHPEIGATSNVPHPYPDEGAWHWYGNVLRGSNAGQLNVFSIWSDEFCGIVSLNSIDMGAGTCEVDYWVARHLWGQGIATDVVRQALFYAKHVIGLGCAFSTCLLRNVGSSRVLEKNGFHEIRKFENRGAFGDKHLESMIRYRKVIQVGDPPLEDPKASL